MKHGSEVLLHPKITAEHLGQKAVVYVRQSSPHQVAEHLESKRRQYELVEKASALGFSRVEVLDNDQAKSAQGFVERPDFERLVADVCRGEVGAIFSIESASRLARNGREWHHLLHFCGLVGTLLIDAEGVHDPGLSDDRLLLGIKGTLAEHELTVMRQRAHEALRAKARRGALRFRLPVGLVWTDGGGIDLDPDRRVQETIRLVLRKFEELGSARQVFLRMVREGLSMPVVAHRKSGVEVSWKSPRYHRVQGIVTNPLYAGAYVFGRREHRVEVADGVARKTRGHVKPQDQWAVLIDDHHPGYITWEQYQRNQAVLADNTHRHHSSSRKSARGGSALLSGMLRCRRCGHMLTVNYSGHSRGTYRCLHTREKQGGDWCIAFGKARVDRAVGDAILQAVEPHAVEAALQASVMLEARDEEQRQALTLELEQARYEARLAARRYDAVDPDKRLVAAELEDRWNACLERVREVEIRLADRDAQRHQEACPDREELLSLAFDLPRLWHDPGTDMRTKQRIARIVLEEVVADVDETAGEIVLALHWKGGRHTHVRVQRPKTGQHSRTTDLNAVAVVRSLADRQPDARIAIVLNRLKMRTGAGNPWNASRVNSLRHRLELPRFDPANRNLSIVTLQEAGSRLGVSRTVVCTLIRRQVLPASQPVPGAPWEIPVEALTSEAVRRAIEASRCRRRPCTRPGENENLEIPGT